MRHTLCLGCLMFATSCWIDKTRPCDGGVACTADLTDASSSADALPASCLPTRMITDPAGSARFGSAVGLSSNEVIVGDPGGSYNGTATGRAQFFNLADGTSYGVLVPRDMNNGSQFGAAVTLANGNAWVGAPGQIGYVARYTSAATANNRNVTGMFPSGADFGKVLAYDGTNLLVPVSTTLTFIAADGTSTSVAAGNLGATAIFDTWAAVNGSGTLNMYQKAGTQWDAGALLSPPSGYQISTSQVAKVALSVSELLASLPTTDGTSQAVVGYSLSTAAWGSPRVILSGLGAVTSLAISDELAAVGVSGSGKAWVLQRRGSQWVAAPLVTDTLDLSTSQFGTAVAVSGNTIAVGAPGSSGAAVYIFTCTLGS